MRIDSSTGFVGFDVYDEAMSRMIDSVLWVDDTALEVVTLEQPLRWTGHELATVVTKVAYVRIDAPAMRILVNTCVRRSVHDPSISAHEQRPQACRDCRQEDTCRRLHYCAAHRSDFGSATP